MRYKSIADSASPNIKIYALEEDIRVGAFNLVPGIYSTLLLFQQPKHSGISSLICGSGKEGRRNSSDWGSKRYMAGHLPMRCITISPFWIFKVKKLAFKNQQTIP